jgi:hypothetical protein
MAGSSVPMRGDWRIADGVRVEELDGSWLALDPSGGVVYRLEARAAEVMRLVAHRQAVPGHLVPAARELAGHGVLAHPFVDRRTALVGAGVVTLTGLAATLLPSAARAASVLWTEPGGTDWPIEGGSFTSTSVGGVTYYFHAFTTVGSSSLTVRDANAVRDVSLLIVGGGGGGGLGDEGAGAGGGAGTLIYVNGGLLPLSSGSASYVLSVTVGNGGNGKGSASSGQGADGGSSTLGGGSGEPFTLTSSGGGGGGGPLALLGRAGGSGGGGGADSGNEGTTNSGGAAGTTPTAAAVADIFSRGTVNAAAEVLQNAGGSGMNAPTGSAGRRRAGGGGGAGAAGANGVSTSGSLAPGNGGSAYSVPDFSAFGASGAFAGGGGGATGEGGALNGGGAGGGAGAGAGADGTTRIGGDASVANTGSGGGGGTDRVPSSGTVGAGGNGASGIVLVRYRLI